MRSPTICFASMHSLMKHYHQTMMPFNYTRRDAMIKWQFIAEPFNKLPRLPDLWTTTTGWATSSIFDDNWSGTRWRAELRPLFMLWSRWEASMCIFRTSDPNCTELCSCIDCINHTITASDRSAIADEEYGRFWWLVSHCESYLIHIYYHLHASLHLHTTQCIAFLCLV